MIDFRYHALSIVAVFIALAIGLLLGATLGDAGLVSGVRANLEDSLNQDLAKARKDERQAEARLADQSRFLDESFSATVRGDLRGQRIAVFGTGEAIKNLLADVTRGVRGASADTAYAGQLRSAPRYNDLRKALGQTPVKTVSEEIARKLGGAVARRLDRGSMRPALRKAAFDRFSGEMGSADGFVFARGDNAGSGEQAKELEDAYQRGLIGELTDSGRTVIGVEHSQASQSQIKWYDDENLSSVDSIDTYPGKYALVQLLNGAEGSFGIKASADALFPAVAR